MANTFLQAEWRKLLMANFLVDPELLLPYLPHKTELDLWDGSCYVSLVGFMFLNTKIKGIKVPFHTNFEEVNLRFYVRYLDRDEWKRGTVFIKEIVPKPALTFVANMVYGEQYETLPMSHGWKTEGDVLTVEYSWKKNDRWNSMKVNSSLTQTDIASGSVEEFITEHYWGYTKITEELTSEYGVEHPVWKVYDIKNYFIVVDFGGNYGHQFGFLNHKKPEYVLLAEGSEIIVKGGRKI